MDHEALASFIWSVENFFFLTNLTDPVAQARLASMWLVNSAAVWLRHQGYNHDTLTWATLKADMQTYFKPADHHRRAWDKLARCVQKGAVAQYIDTMKRIA